MDLDIVPGTVLLDVELCDGERWDADQLPSNETHSWRVQLPKNQDTGNKSINDTVGSILAIFYKILRGLSVMSAEDFEKHFRNDWVPRTLQHAFFARRYCEEIDFFFPQGRYGAIGRDAAEHTISAKKWEPREPEELKWFGGIHPRFNEQGELSRIQKRYDVSLAGLRYTLPRLRKSPEFNEMVKRFQTDGWKDWHILAAVLNVVAGIRVTERCGPTAATREWAEAFTAEVFAPETETALEVLPHQIKSESVFFTMQANMTSTMSGNGLNPNSRTPNLEGEKRYLASRWRYFELDVPHQSILNQ
jgi:hypothetical protein